MLEPDGLAFAAKSLLAVFALDWILIDVVADAADELGEECLDLPYVYDFVFFEDVLRVLTTFINNALHK